MVAGGPLTDNTLGPHLTVWYRRDGGYIDLIDPVSLATAQKNANFDQTVLYRLAFIYAPSDQWTITPSIYYQDRYRNQVEDYWPLYSNPSKDRLVSADPDQRSDPDRRDRKSTRLNSSHQIISYAVFCLKKKKNNETYKNLSQI